MIKFQYDLERIKKELSTLPEYKKQLYLQGYSKDMNPEEGAGEGYAIDNVEQHTRYLFLIYHILMRLWMNII